MVTFAKNDDFFLKATSTSLPPLFIEDYDVYKWAIVAALLFTFARFILVKFVFLPLANKFMTAEMKTAHFDMENRFCESLFRALYYAPSWLTAFLLWQREPWAWDRVAVWDNYPYHEMSEGLWMLNVVQLGWYFHCTFAHLCLDSRKHDFYQMLLHHFTAICLINFSVSSRYPRLGLLVYVSLDICDVFLEMAKVFRYIGFNRSATVSFLCLVISWLFCRLGLYPYLVVFSGTFTCPSLYPDPAFYYYLVPPAWILLALQIYWFYLILRIAYRYVVLSGELDDDREPVFDEDGKTKGSRKAAATPTRRSARQRRSTARKDQ